MELQDNLTNLQKVALKGEVAYAVTTATHDGEIKYRIYSILREVEEEYKPFLIQAFKEAVTFNENIVDKLYLETLTNEVPVWLWVEKIVGDIKESIYLTESTSLGRISVNKIKEKKKIIESAFINFARKVLFISPDAGEQLFESIIDDYDLDFLHTSCFYLKSCCEEVRDSGTVQDKVPEALMECMFDIRDMLSLRIEMEAMEALDKVIGKGRKSTQKKKPSMVRTHQIEVSPDMTDEEISELIGKRVLEAFQELNLKKPKKQQFKYAVNKVYNNTQISTTIRVCDTKEEAEKFIEKIKKEYPELQNSCDFFISKEREDGKK